MPWTNQKGHKRRFWQDQSVLARRPDQDYLRLISRAAELQGQLNVTTQAACACSLKIGVCLGSSVDATETRIQQIQMNINVLCLEFHTIQKIGTIF